MRDLLRAAAPGSADDLDRLCERLRGIQYNQVLRLKHPDTELGLEPELSRVIALHLLRTGRTRLEIMTGLDLLATDLREEDIDLVREIALLQHGYGFTASEMLRASQRPGHSLYWLAVRSSPPDQALYADLLGMLSAEDMEELLTGLSVPDSIEILRMMSHRSQTPKWIKGSKHFTTALAQAAKRPELFGSGITGLVAITQVRDDLLYGHSALLDLEQGTRATVARDLLTALRAPQARELVSSALADDPQDSEAIWLHRYIENADDRDGDFPPGLAIRIATPAPSTRQAPRTHLVVDGVPLVTSLFDHGAAGIPPVLLHRNQGLRTSAEVHEVWLAEADCTEGCCGVLAVRIRRDEATGRVLWDVKATRGGTETAQFAFDAREYDAEVARAEADYSWEWPALRAARMLNRRLRDDPSLLSRWDCCNYGAVSWNFDRSILRLILWHPEPPNPDRPWLQFQYRTEIPDATSVDDDAVAATVEEILERLRTNDPKSIGKLCGGSEENAKALGYPWPPVR
ncbi:hypothetical protein [Glycomyces salinus]|uniref:hypothetical protein n=1 Tax=Glycomyces salinus TaxID=980294 RepID=UPI0018EC8DEA|nr:hypothetical protein [Glycomyces salinus]